MLNLCKQKVKFNYNFSKFLVHTNVQNFKWGGGNKTLRYKGLCRNFNINNMTTSSSFRYNYL